MRLPSLLFRGIVLTTLLVAASLPSARAQSQDGAADVQREMFASPRRVEGLRPHDSLAPVNTFLTCNVAPDGDGPHEVAFLPNGTAVVIAHKDSDNLAFFDSVNLAVVAANDSAGGRDFIDALTAAGFDRSAMQVTADRTTVDLQAGSVQFSVRFDDECLVGQYGPESGGYHGAVRPALGHGGCLVGQTRPIDW